jgi:hypothetical protein
MSRFAYSPEKPAISSRPTVKAKSDMPCVASQNGEDEMGGPCSTNGVEEERV